MGGGGEVVVVLSMDEVGVVVSQVLSVNEVGVVVSQWSC